MWGAKWVICSIVLHNHIFGEVLGRIRLHTGDVEIMGEKLSSLDVLWKNIKVFVQMPYLLLGMVVFVLLNYKKERKIKQWINIIPLIGIAIVPVVWILATKSHAGWCYWYTSRGLMGTVFALACAWVYFLYSKEPLVKDIGKGQ